MRNIGDFFVNYISGYSSGSSNRFLCPLDLDADSLLVKNVT
jgi:hypothetical protein